MKVSRGAIAAVVIVCCFGAYMWTQTDNESPTAAQVEPSPDPLPNPTLLRSAVLAYLDAAQGKRAPADLISKRCSGKTDDLPETLPRPVRLEAYSSAIVGDVGLVTYSVGSLDRDRERWAFEDGSWRLDDC